MSIIVNSMWVFVFALMKCSYAAFGEQNKTDNDSKCQLVYKSLKKIVPISKHDSFDKGWKEINLRNQFLDLDQCTYLRKG